LKEALHREYLEDDHWWFSARRSIFRGMLTSFAPLPRDARVLDVGPGSGINLPVLRDCGSVTALDLSKFSLAHCREAGARNLVLADAASPPFDGESFDLVCVLDVLEHLANDAEALRGYRRILKREGYLLLSVPALSCLWGRQDVISGHHRRYRRGKLAKLLAETGFQVERLTYFNTLLLPPILVVRLLMRPFLRWTCNGGSDLSMPMPLGLDRLVHRALTLEGDWILKHDLPLGVSLLALARPRP
jgi:SAM-dependent methyltransferase